MAWSPRQILILLLAVLVTAGPGFAAVQANAMSVKMALMADDGMTMPSMPDLGSASDCEACARGAGDQANQMPCSPVCVAPALAVLPQVQALAAILGTPPPPALWLALLHGRNALPDPTPPRSSDLV